MKKRLLFAVAATGLTISAHAETAVYMENAKCVAEIKADCLKKPLLDSECSAFGGRWSDVGFGGGSCILSNPLIRPQYCDLIASKSPTCITVVQMPNSADLKAMMTQFREENDGRLKAILSVLKEGGAAAPSMATPASSTPSK
ncbi:MAG: hypothetical protein V4607_09675 [Pseudomonadota bacterium]